MVRVTDHSVKLLIVHRYRKVIDRDLYYTVDSKQVNDKKENHNGDHNAVVFS